TAGIEWYDSGIGFAIPLEDIVTVLPRLKEGKDLKRGLLGFTWQSNDIYSARPIVGNVLPESAAAKAGLKTGDIVVEIDGAKIERQSQAMHALGRKYSGDSIALKYKRGEEVKEINPLQLTEMTTSFSLPFLGILPMRDDAGQGVEIRYVYPKSPADEAGL